MLARYFPRFFALLLAVSTLHTACAEAPFSFEATPGKLPKNIVPRHYDIRLEPDLDEFTTHGTVTVDLEVLKPANEIIFNALDLVVTRATLLAQKETALKPTEDTNLQTVTLKLPEVLPPGKSRLVLEFSGKITEQAQGLFYVKYPTPSGKKIMLGTQMEPTDARRMFPGWDEPVFRATYDLTVVVPEKHLGISNMPIEHEKSLGNGLKEVKFARTPPMASYLVVFVSGELEELKGQSEGVQLRVITTEGKKEQGRYALEATKELLRYYDDYFGIKYPLPKLDQIAVPGGFSGAMENWGGITYNESMLLFDPKTSSLQTKQEIFTTVAHEMSHQWFGNLVTMAWWDNLWLNEGFATWMEHKATDHFNRNWQMWLAASAEKSDVMGGDARSTTHPIQTPVTTESEANDAFDNITYQKGGAIIRMLENYLGPEVFRRGIHRYLADHSYSNTTTADLWNALETDSGKPIKLIASSWTEQPGLPLVTVRADCINGRQIVSLEQERFSVQDPGATPLQWEIPVALQDTTHPKNITTVLMAGKTLSTALPDCTTIVKADAGDAGYYRVSYDPALFARLQKNLAQFPSADQLGLLDDSWALVEAGRDPVTNYFALVESLRHEKTAALWDQIMGTLIFIDSLERKQPGHAAFQQYACALLRPQLQRLGWKDRFSDNPPDSLLRTHIIEMLGHFGDSAVIAEAKARFETFIADPESLPADLRPAVLQTVGRYSDRKIYDEIHRLARDAQGTEERQLYYQALASSLDPALARETLALSLTDESVPEETTALVIHVATSGEHPELAWSFAREHIKDLLAKVDSFDRNNYVPSILASFSDAALADELESYVKENIAEGAFARAKQTAENIRFKSALKKRDLAMIDAWVAARIRTTASSN